MRQIAKSLVQPSHLQLIEAAQAIREKPASDSDDIAFLARQLVQATLPHAAPLGTPPEWARTNGNLTLAIRPGYKTDQRTGKRVCIGYPFGTMRTISTVRSQCRSHGPQEAGTTATWHRLNENASKPSPEIFASPSTTKKIWTWLGSLTASF